MLWKKSLVAGGLICAVSPAFGQTTTQPRVVNPPAEVRAQVRESREERRDERRDERKETVRQNLDSRTERQVEPRASDREDNQARSNRSDADIATVVRQCGLNEIEMLKFGQTRLQSNEAKQFAEKALRDHEAGLAKLQRFALPQNTMVARTANSAEPATGTNPTPRVDVRAGGVEVKADPNRPAVAERVERAAERVVDRAERIIDRVEGAADGRNLNWVQIQQQIGEQCTTLAKAELQKKSGEQFDKAFLGQQYGAHHAMVSELTVLRNHAFPELRQELDHCLETATAHLNEVRTLMDSHK